MQPVNNKLTHKQKLIYDFICKQYDRNGYAPTLKEIGEQFKFGTSASQSFVNILTDKGYLSKTFNSARSVIPKKEAMNNMSISLPLLGTISAGYGIQVDEASEPEIVEVPASMAKNSRDFYCLRVSGWSMRDSDIADRDIIVVRHQAVADNGETIVAILKEGFDEKATLKMFYHRGSCIELVPRNKDYKKITIPIEQAGNFEIRGIFCGLIRQA